MDFFDDYLKKNKKQKQEQRIKMPRVFYEDEDDDNVLSKHACSSINVETTIGIDAVKFYKKLHFKTIVNNNARIVEKEAEAKAKAEARAGPLSPSKSPKRLKKFPENATEKELEEYYEYMTK